jgi:ElaB/YqjD/DUF883 family membrane-anchored ribosome-binding protein
LLLDRTPFHHTRFALIIELFCQEEKGANTMFFQRKKKSRVEQARDDIEKQFRVVNKQATKTRKDLSKRLSHSAEDLRSNLSHVFSREEQQRLANIASELEHIAQNAEHRAEKSIGEVTETARQNLWLTVLIAFALGIFAGLVTKELLD